MREGASGGAEGRYYDRYWTTGVEGWRVAAGLSPALKRLMLTFASQKSVLDFGGGDGHRYADVLRAASTKYVVADVSEQALASRRELGDEAINISDLASFPEAFDVVFALEVLEHVLDPAEALDLMVSKCRPNGRVVISVPNAFSAVNRLRMAFGRLPASGVGGAGVRGRTYAAPHIRFFDLDSLLNLLAGSGLEMESVLADGMDTWRMSRLSSRTAVYGHFWNPAFKLLARTFVAVARPSSGAVSDAA